MRRNMEVNMNAIRNLIMRNLMRYFRDKGALFFSFLSVFIVVGLYIFFLADMQIQNLNSELGNLSDVNHMVYAWIIGGLLCIPSVSVPLFMLTFKVEDFIEGAQDDMLVTPVKRSYIMLGYILAAWITGVVMTVLTLVFGEVFIIAKGGALLSVIDYLKIFGIIILSVLVYSGFSFFFIIRLRTNSSLSIMNTFLNTLIGFFAGLYFPLGYLSDEIAIVIKLFPLAHTAALFRNIMMEKNLEQTFQNTTIAVMGNMKQEYGLDLEISGHIFSSVEMVSYIAVFGLIFYIASIISLKRYKRK